MALVVEAELSGAPLLLAVLVELWVGDDGLDLAPVAQGELLTLRMRQPLFVLRADGQHDGDGLVGDPVVQEAVEVLTLQELSLPHEAGEGGGPALAQHLEPLQVHLAHLDTLQLLSLGQGLAQLGLGDGEVHHLLHHAPGQDTLHR